MSARFTDRFGQEYVVLFSGREELLPPRVSLEHPLNAMGHYDASRSKINARSQADSAKERERAARSKRLQAVARAGLHGGGAMNLWLDDERHPAMFGCLGWTWVKTAAEAIAALETGTVEECSLDHDLGLCDECFGADTDAKVQRVRESLIRNEGAASYCACPHNGTGYDVVCWMERTGRWPATKPRVHSANPVGAQRMRQVIDRHYRMEMTA